MADAAAFDRLNSLRALIACAIPASRDAACLALCKFFRDLRPRVIFEMYVAWLCFLFKFKFMPAAAFDIMGTSNLLVTNLSHSVCRLSRFFFGLGRA
eukprot:2682386-Pleurochrysis_carterae.AAC.1